MSAPLSPVAKMKVAVPVGFLLLAFIIYTFGIFVADFRVSQIIGALLTFVSCILWIIARVQLGDAPAEGRLVTKGLYGEVRHPIYYFSTTALLGAAIFMWLTELLIICILIAIFQGIRIHYEEKALVRKMGRRYQRYKNRTLM